MICPIFNGDFPVRYVSLPDYMAHLPHMEWIPPVSTGIHTWYHRPPQISDLLGGPGSGCDFLRSPGSCQWRSSPVDSVVQLSGAADAMIHRYLHNISVSNLYQIYIYIYMAMSQSPRYPK